MTVSAPRADVLAPRLGPGTRREIGALNALIVRAIGLATGGRPPNVFTTLARHRRLFRAWLRFAGRLMPRGTLPRVDTELVILRVAHNCDCDYEWRHHERIGAAQGLSPADIARFREGPTSAGLTARRAALLEAADDLHEARALSEHAWAALRPELSDAQLIELCMLVGHYEMLAMTLNSLRVAPDELGGRRSPIAGIGRRRAR